MSHTTAGGRKFDYPDVADAKRVGQYSAFCSCPDDTGGRWDRILEYRVWIVHDDHSIELKSLLSYAEILALVAMGAKILKTCALVEADWWWDPISGKVERGTRRCEFALEKLFPAH